MQEPIDVMVYPAGSGNYAAEVDGLVVVKSTKTPLLAAARYLLAHDGGCRDRTITMSHLDSDHIALSTTVAVAARRTVEDGISGRPMFAAWRP